MAALKEVIAAVPEDIPVLLDAKRGDIGTTAAAYASAAFEVGTAVVSPRVLRKTTKYSVPWRERTATETALGITVVQLQQQQ